MCCFSEEVEEVGDTRIFAGPDQKSPDRQVLVYEMSYRAPGALAMVLPLPVPPRPGEDAVEFIDLSSYPDFFADLERGGPFRAVDDDLELLLGGDEPEPRLVVHDVGDFEASFVPTTADFARLEPRFRLPDTAWERLPAYADYGFAVFKLKEAGLTRRVHPMALSFPRRDPGLLYFPTLHIHDGTVHGAAEFDHTIYVQPRDGPLRDMAPETDGSRIYWNYAGDKAATYMKFSSMGERLMDPGKGRARLHVQGRFENKDITLGEAGGFPQPLPDRWVRAARAGRHSEAELGSLESWQAQARAAGVEWMVLARGVQRPCASEQEVAAAFAQFPFGRAYRVDEPFADQGGGLSRFHWQAGDRS